MKLFKLVVSAGVGLAVTAALALPAAAPAGGATLVANWPMNEQSGSVMQDVSGNGLHGTIGSLIELGEATPDGSKAYRFRNAGGVTHDRLVLIPDDPRIDPGDGTFKVTWRLKTGHTHPNISQKGQAGTRGGMYKFVLSEGWPRCHFEGANGSRLAVGFIGSTNPATTVTDGKWHTVSCEKTPTGVSVTIDGITKTAKGKLGNIDNHYPMTLGGKWACDGDVVGCDYFPGVIDWVTIERS